MNQSVAKLVRFGYQRQEVGDMPLPRFVACLDAVEQILAAERTAFVSDMTAVVAGMFAKKGSNPVKEHLDRLDDVWRGGFNGNDAQRS